MEDEVLATVQASAPRRMFGLLTMLLLGAMLIYLGLTIGADATGTAFLLLLGAACLWATVRLQRATASAIELRRDGLYDREGTLIAAIDQIERMDRGTFAFKPSNGFILKLSTPQGRAWRPGLWWRIGRRVGVGGVTAAPQTKAMSEIIAAMIHKREE
jgi:hypothetical protein